MKNIAIIHLSPGQIKPRKRKFRVHPKHQIELIAQSLKDYGCIEPVLVDSENRIVCGEAVVEAARLIDLNQIPTVRADRLSDAQLQAYALAANKLAELAGYDEELLSLELADINELLGEPDLTSLGFEPAELDRLLGLTDIELDAAANTVPDIDPDNAICRLGDLWLLGEHRLYCGDALEPNSYVSLMAGEQAQLILSDVPYNLSADAISGNGKFKHRDFVQAAGEMSVHEFTRFLTKSMRCMREHSADGSLHMLFMSWHYLPQLLRAGTIVFDELKNIITWVKKQGGQGSFYRSQTEFIAVFKNGTAKHVNNIQLGKFGRNRTNAWFFDGMNTPGKDRDALLALHPTVKPLDLLCEAILDCSKKGQIVLDPFAGTGSMIIAAEKVGRRGYGMELDPLYADVALRRFWSSTGIMPVRQRDGATLEETQLLDPADEVAA